MFCVMINCTQSLLFRLFVLLLCNVTISNFFYLYASYFVFEVSLNCILLKWLDIIKLKYRFYFETFHHPARGCLSRDCVTSSDLVLAETDITSLLMSFSFNLYCLWREYVKTKINT